MRQNANKKKQQMQETGRKEPKRSKEGKMGKGKGKKNSRHCRHGEKRTNEKKKTRTEIQSRQMRGQQKKLLRVACGWKKDFMEFEKRSWIETMSLVFLFNSQTSKQMKLLRTLCLHQTANCKITCTRKSERFGSHANDVVVVARDFPTTSLPIPRDLKTDLDSKQPTTNNQQPPTTPPNHQPPPTTTNHQQPPTPTNNTNPTNNNQQQPPTTNNNQQNNVQCCTSCHVL